MALLRYFGLLALAAILFMLSGLAGGTAPSQSGGPECTLILSPQDKIQDIINKLTEGREAVICLGEGMYRENLEITKSLTLRGQGSTVNVLKATAIIGDDPDAPVILIKSESSKQIKVVLEDFTVARPVGSDALAPESDGIEIRGDVSVTIIGLEITGNGHNGLVIGGSAEAEVESSTIEANGTYEGCDDPKFICNGIEVWGKSKTTIIDSEIMDNTDWGIAAVLEKCGYDSDQFTGRVTIDENTEIENNNRSGNHYGQECLP